MTTNTIADMLRYTDEVFAGRRDGGLNLAARRDRTFFTEASTVGTVGMDHPSTRIWSTALSSPRTSYTYAADATGPSDSPYSIKNLFLEQLSKLEREMGELQGDGSYDDAISDMLAIIREAQSELERKYGPL